MIKLIFTFLYFSFISNVFAQYPWSVTNISISPRYEDVHFLNKDTGFAVSGSGYIYKTINGGQNWDSVYHNNQYIRSVEFSSHKRGFAGSLLSNGGPIFMKTLDGGITWIDISSLVTISNKGICGICCIDTNVTYAVGVWGSPAYVIKTVDGGTTWNQIDMSAYASRLIDVQFIDKNIGYVIGGSNVVAEGGVILKTIDGGITWNKVHVTNNIGDYIWKIQNLDNINWFCSIQRGNMTSTNKIIKSIDGGNTWIEKDVSISSGYFQMVGFINKNKGWAGYSNLFETNDGGNSWTQLAVPLNSFNRFFRIDSTSAYISGNYIYKLDGIVNGIKENKSSDNKSLDIKVNPNPQSNPVKITVNVIKRTAFNFRVLDSNGKELIYCSNGVFESGENFIHLNKDLDKGIYYIWVMVNEGVVTKKFIVD